MPEAASSAAPLRVALLTHSLNPRGGVVHVLELGRALVSLGHRVTIVAPARRGERMFRATPCDVSLAPVDAPVDAAGGAAVGGLHESVRTRIAAMRMHLQALV